MSSDAPQPASPDADPDALLDRVVAGDDVARTQFFRTHAPKVDRFVRFTFGLGYDDADDVVQQTMIAAFKDIARFDRRRSVENWLCGIAAMKVKSLRRTRGRAATADAEAVRGADASARAEEAEQVEANPGRRSPPPGPPHPATDAPYAAWGREIAAWLATQPLETRIVARRFTDDASYEQLAADLSQAKGQPITEIAVRQRTSRFARDFEDRFGQVLPRSRVRITPADDVPQLAHARRQPAHASARE